MDGDKEISLHFEGYDDDSLNEKEDEPIFATSYEVCAVLSSRAVQLASLGVRKDFLPPQVPLDFLNEPIPKGMRRPRFDPLKIAIEELKAGKLDMEVKRHLCNGQTQIINIKDMIVHLSMLPEEW